MSVRNRIIVAILGVVMPTIVFGHPGHGVEPHAGFLHYITEPMHWALFLGVVTVCMLAIKGVRKFLAAVKH